MAYSDASCSGYGGYVVEYGKENAHGQWSEEEACLSFTWRELKAIHAVMESFVPKLQDHAIKWFTDNQSVKLIVTYGSKKSHLQHGVLCIFETCMKFSLKLE